MTDYYKDESVWKPQPADSIGSWTLEEEHRMDIIGRNGNTGEHYKVNKYLRTITTSNGEGDVDVYDVLYAFDVANPAMQHAIKKMLCAGRRGHKDYLQDIDEAIQALERAKSFVPVPF